jgi:hypothetical protein
MRFHMARLTLEFHQVRPKRFLSLWYIQHKMCTYLVSRLAPSLDEPKQAFTWASSPSCTIRLSKRISEPLARFSQTLHPSYTDTNTVSKWNKTRLHMNHITKEFHRVRPKCFPSQCYVRRKLCTYLASRLALSPNRLKWAPWASSPRSTFGCVQNNF